MENYGNRTEDLIQTICTRMFFSDFTVRNPKYKKEDGNEREAADFLIPFRDVLLAFQVKSKVETKNANQKNRIDFDRIKKKVQEGVDQLKEIKKVIKLDRIASLKTVKGLDIPFQCSQVKKIIGIVILDLIGEERFPKDMRTAIFNGFTIKAQIPVHIFMREDFEEISNELDTLPDFLRYVNIRETLRTRNALSPFVDELDFLALFKTNWPMIEDLLKDKYDHLILESGIWESYSKKRQVIEERNKKNMPSYIVDRIIATLYRSIGFDLEIDVPGARKSDYAQGTVDNYMRSITELASFDRLRRRGIGEAFLEKTRKADTHGMGYRLLIPEDKDNRAVLVLASDGSRKERIDKLYQLCSIAYCRHNLNKIIGIATEPFKAKLRSEDIVILEDVNFSNREEILEISDKFFGPKNYGRVTEY